MYYSNWNPEITSSADSSARRGAVMESLFVQQLSALFIPRLNIAVQSGCRSRSLIKRPSSHCDWHFTIDPWLSVLVNITSPGIRRNNALVREWKKILENPFPSIHKDLDGALSFSRLKSRKPIRKKKFATSESDYIYDPVKKWRYSWSAKNLPNKQIIDDPKTKRFLWGTSQIKIEW